MEKVNLTAEVRAEFGKGDAKRLRASGLIPAILYGQNMEPIALSVHALDLRKVISTETRESVLIELNVEAGEETQTRNAMLKELQTHPVKGDHIHADFYAIAMDEKIVMPVSIRFIGKAKGVESGGILRQVKREIEIRALPSLIPSHIEVDVSDLEIGHVIHVEDIELEEGVEILDSSDLTLVTVLTPTVVKEEEEVALEEEEIGEEEKESSVDEGKEG